MNIYDRNVTASELGAYRRTLAKRANQRLVRLERAESKVTGEKYTFGAYDIAEQYLKGQWRTRFSETAKHKINNINSLRAEINELERFLNSKSSTVKGIREIEQKRIETFEKKGLHFASTKEFYDFLNSNEYDRLIASGFTSEQVIEVYDMSRQYMSDEDVLEKIQEAITEFQSIQGDSATLKGLYSKMGLELKV